MSVTLKLGELARGHRRDEARALWGFRSDTLLHLGSVCLEFVFPLGLVNLAQGREHSLAFIPTGPGQQAAPCFQPKGPDGVSAWQIRGCVLQ